MFSTDLIVSSRGIVLAVSNPVSGDVDTFSLHAYRHRLDEAHRRAGPMESNRCTTDGSRRADATISDVANVQNEVAMLFRRFRLDLGQMFGRSPSKAETVNDG
jgi:hypothetical protein